MSDESLKMINGNEPPLDTTCDGCACRDSEIEMLRGALERCREQMGIGMLGQNEDFVVAYNNATYALSQ
ncbi:MAG: hypothetical protein KAI73_02150 [Rhodospirillaceae bacterium]|nr:hypothetical protein [Rhodospirillaceae bacterium]